MIETAITGQVRFVAGGEVWDEIRSAASRTGRGKATIAVSYLTDGEFLPLRSGDTLVVNLDDATLKAGLTDPSVVLKYLKAGVAIFRSPGLHAKVYIFGRKTIIGSPNTSKHSRQLGESIAVIDGDESARAARKMITASLQPIPVDKATLQGMQQIYRPARGDGRSVPFVPRPLDPATDRVWLVHFMFGGLPEEVFAASDKAVRAARRRVGQDDITQIESYNSDEVEQLAAGDLVIFLGEYAESDEAVYPPVRVLDRHELPRKGRSPGWTLFTTRASLEHEPVTVAQLREVLNKHGMRHTGRQRQLKDVEARRAVLALWDDLPAL
jgi:hypothetical protein